MDLNNHEKNAKEQMDQLNNWLENDNNSSLLNTKKMEENTTSMIK